MNRAVRLQIENEQLEKEVLKLREEIEQLNRLSATCAEPETPEESAPGHDVPNPGHDINELTAENERLRRAWHKDRDELIAEIARLSAENNSLRDGVQGLRNELTAEIARLSKELAEAQTVANPPRRILDAAAAAEYCGTTVAAMQNLRSRGLPPLFQKVSGR